MATIYPPNNRNRLGPRVALEWGPLTSAKIDGWASDFSAIVGGETIDIGVGAGVPSTITMQAGDDSAAAVAARINVTYPGLATTKDGGKRLRLEHATRVRVTADPAFDMIGLPIEDRDVAALASESYVVPIVFAFDRFAEVCSSAIEIPIEANRIGLWVGVEGRDTTTHNRWGIQFHAMWSNGDEGEPPYTTAIGTNETIADPSPIYPSGDEAVGAITLLHSNSFILVGSVEGFKFVRYMEYEVPIGAKRMRLFTTGAASTEANPYTTTNPPPLIAPALSCAAFVGVRS